VAEFPSTRAGPGVEIADATPANWWGEEMERRLAAVLAADVAGYSRLMGEDEERTLRRLNAGITVTVHSMVATASKKAGARSRQAVRLLVHCHRNFI
jgi:class 3 adenylate cyclase